MITFHIRYDILTQHCIILNSIEVKHFILTQLLRRLIKDIYFNYKHHLNPHSLNQRDVFS